MSFCELSTYDTNVHLKSRSETPFREIRAIHDDEYVRVYQAYSDQIADLAVAANSFEAPRKAGCWSETRMTWVKPSAIWMAYRCGWSTMKDARQARVLALDLSRPKFEAMLMGASLSTHDQSKGTCKDSSVVVQWDPEREMFPEAEPKQVFTRGLTNVRSIQIGLRGPSVAMLLDPTFVLRIRDVTCNFREAAAALTSAKDVHGASTALWRHRVERPMQLPPALRQILCMDMEQAQSNAASGRVPAPPLPSSTHLPLTKVPPTTTSVPANEAASSAVVSDSAVGVVAAAAAVQVPPPQSTTSS